jgi:hypothetical protein
MEPVSKSPPYGGGDFLMAGKTAGEYEIMDKTNMENKGAGNKMSDLNAIITSIRSTGNKDSNAYKVTEYYTALITGDLDEGGIALVRGKILNIEKYLIEWTKEHPNNGTTIMQPEESALILIDDLRKRGLLK